MDSTFETFDGMDGIGFMLGFKMCLSGRRVLVMVRLYDNTLNHLIVSSCVLDDMNTPCSTH